MYNASEHVWTTDRFLDYLERTGVDWRGIEIQVRGFLQFYKSVDRLSGPINPTGIDSPKLS